MSKPSRLWKNVAAAAAFLAFTRPLAAAPPPDPAALEFFEKKVRPVLAEHCYQCHSDQAKSPRGGLRVDSRAALLKGGDSGPALVSGDPEKSRLVKAIHYQDVDLRMPPKAKLPDAAVADLTAWVKMGAPWPGGDVPAAAVKSDEFDLLKRKRAHWAWQPVRPPKLPEVRDQSWPRSPADRFLLAKLEAKGLTPAPAADPRTLLRRLCFDLIGLPPTPEEVEQFVKEYGAKPQAAVEKLVDRLLASPHFGERWGRHWLDLMRYAETRGHEFDHPIPNAYQYRDYVIRAFNADVPYNQFVTEHVAGDLLRKPRLHPTEGFNESILGTGFWFLGEEVHSPVDIRQDQADRFDNRIDVLTKAFLGLTVACARCHDHKFDAISTKDYYALVGFLESSNYRQVRFDSLPHNRRIAKELEELRWSSATRIQQVLWEMLAPAMKQTADYLLTARAVMLAGPNPPLKEIAQARKLDARRLEAWVRHLRAAAMDEHDPLHAWARLAADANTGDPKRAAESLKPLLESWRKRAADDFAALKGFETVIYYSAVNKAHWLPDDVTFGSRPVRPGDFYLGMEATRPLLRVVDYTAAEIDPTWHRLKFDGGEAEPGALGRLVGAGRTIRTPTFTLTDGKVYYLVRGTGRAYAAVGQHVLISGPLHGGLVASIKAGDRFQWVGHDLTAYKGLRTHIEFTAEGPDFAIKAVVQGPTAPGPRDPPNRLLLQMLGRNEVRIKDLARRYQEQLFSVLQEFSAGLLDGAINAADKAQLMNWVIQRPELFVTDRRAAEKELQEKLGDIFRDQSKLLAQIRTESRRAPAMQDGTGQDEHVFIRGSPRALGERVPRRFLEALAGPRGLAVSRGSGRLELVRQMTDPALNPFLARVIVNRVWHHLFGRGLVASVDNFGVLGEAPTHPELLDHLADRFVKEGWSVKKLIRALVLTRSYQQSAISSQPENAQSIDPENRLLGRMNICRLEGEAIRDAMLAASGQLDRTMYGPSVPVHLTAFQDGRGKPTSGPLDGDSRRSVYLAVRRNFLSSFLLAFDTPTPFSTVGRRTVSNVPAQALILMNDPFVHQQAERWAKRMVAEGGSAAERITRMYLSAFGRPPTDAERDACLDFLERQASANDVAAWKDLAHVLFNAKEFIYIQ